MAGSTRNASAGSQKQGRNNTAPSRSIAAPPPTDAMATGTSEPGEANDESLLSTLSKENKTLVKIIKVIILQQFKIEIETLKEEMNRKDSEMEQLKSEVKDLKNKVAKLETQIDDVEQYERSDTIILSGPAVPPETQACRKLSESSSRHH